MLWGWQDMLGAERFSHSAFTTPFSPHPHTHVNDLFARRANLAALTLEQHVLTLVAHLSCPPAQIGYATVFFWEYFGPMMVYPLFYFLPQYLYPGHT